VIPASTPSLGLSIRFTATSSSVSLNRASLNGTHLAEIISAQRGILSTMGIAPPSASCGGSRVVSLGGPLRATLPAAVLIGLSFHSLAHRYCRLMPDSLKQRPAGFFLPTKVCRCQRLCGVQKKSGQITGHFAGYSTALLLRVAYEYAWHRPAYCNFYPNVRKYAHICHM
jgi:hypothetical protein